MTVLEMSGTQQANEPWYLQKPQRLRGQLYIWDRAKVVKQKHDLTVALTFLFSGQLPSLCFRGLTYEHMGNSTLAPAMKSEDKRGQQILIRL